MTTTFETAKIGDKVWCITSGWGEIHDTGWSDRYPISVEFPDGEFRSYTLGGLYTEYDKTQSLFWGEVVIEAPAKPLPELDVDTKVLVWNNSRAHASNAHFCCFENGKIYTYDNGRTSFTRLLGDGLKGWNHWELAE